MTEYSQHLKLRTPETSNRDWSDDAAYNPVLVDRSVGSLLSTNRVLSGGGATYTIGGESIVIAATEAWVSGARVSLQEDFFGPNLPTGEGTTIFVWIYIDEAGGYQMSETPPSGSFLPLFMAEMATGMGIVRGVDLRQYGYASPLLPEESGADFSDSDLVSGVLTYTHDLNVEFPAMVTVWDATGEIIQPDKVSSIDADSIAVDISSFTPISGTWHLSIRS